MKNLMVFLLAGCLVILSPGFRTVAVGDDAEIPAGKLNGTYAVTQHGSLFFCVKDTDPFPPAACGSAGSVGFPLTILLVGSVTGDNGTSCATLTQTATDLPVNIFPPGVEVFHSVGKTISYDPVTGTGDIGFTTYSGGHCNGASFDNTGATVVSTGTNHFAASNRGKQIDFVTTALSSPVGAIGGFSFSGTALRH
jgi:hypothetical protein